MMMQSKRKKTTTINIDKINGIENENEIDGFVITDEVKEQFSHVNSELLKKVTGIGEITKAFEGFTSSIQDVFTRLSSLLAESGLDRAITMQSIGTQIGLGLGTWFTPEMHEAMRLFGERMRAKQAIEVDRYNNFTNVGMSKEHGFDCSISTKKEHSDFMLFVVFSIDKEDERYQLSFQDFLMSITVTEWRDWGADYYILQRDKTLNRDKLKKQLSTPPEIKQVKQLSTPAPKAKEQGDKQKAGRPESKEVAKRNNEIYKEYLRLTETRTDAEAKGILLTTFKKYFCKEYETNRRNLDRIIKKTKDNN